MINQMKEIDTNKLGETVEQLIHAAISLRNALTKAREEMPVCYVAHEVNLAEHRVGDAIASLRTARKWTEDEYMNGTKSLEELLIDVNVTIAKCDAVLSKPI